MRRIQFAHYLGAVAAFFQASWRWSCRHARSRRRMAHWRAGERFAWRRGRPGWGTLSFGHRCPSEPLLVL